MLTRTGRNSVVAHSALCTHQQCPIEATTPTFQCPCHGSRFDARSGAVVNGPATTPLAAIRVRIADGAIYLA